VNLLSPFSSLVMQTPIFLTKLSDESIIFIIDVGKNNCYGPCCKFGISTISHKNVALKHTPQCTPPERDKCSSLIRQQCVKLHRLKELLWRVPQETRYPVKNPIRRQKQSFPPHPPLGCDHPRFSTCSMWNFVIRIIRGRWRSRYTHPQSQSKYLQAKLFKRALWASAKLYGWCERAPVSGRVFIRLEIISFLVNKRC
jgi:hypothetical protein